MPKSGELSNRILWSQENEDSFGWQKSRKELLGLLLKNTACFTKNGLKKRIVLHELFHHLVEVSNLEMPLRTEEKEANCFARDFLTKSN
jgi:hypothetical protein